MGSHILKWSMAQKELDPYRLAMVVEKRELYVAKRVVSFIQQIFTSKQAWIITCYGITNWRSGKNY
jgi:hypothetical protein